ncbi:Protein kinase-like domain superfamily [Arabidopsis suecica]|uniref:Protein kinase-like domain superfamily n=1 Tax=Arabidopsis suecica TaxID=45249 RepID=A0A8T2APD2_ARASU|nr:Protein kinase-like domain superfamily [Arabidopsis suecica]
MMNGSSFLKELISDCNGTSNPICIFYSDQILKATNYFVPSGYMSRHRFISWHKGIIQERCYLIKRFKEEYILGVYASVVYNDIVISARVSNHNSFLKLLRSCLEFPLPVLVFEYAENGAMNDQGGVGNENRQLLQLNVRLKITKEVANAVTYLHMAFPRIIIHREIKPTNVFLDKNWKAKLSDLSFSISLPEGKSWIKDKVMGTLGYIDPSYLATGIVTEYTDVFSFGIFLLVLLSGRPAILPGSSDSIHDYVKGLQDKGEFFELRDEFGKKSMYAFLELALRCCETRKEERPKMIEVAKEIKLIERSLDAAYV